MWNHSPFDTISLGFVYLFCFVLMFSTISHCFPVVSTAPAWYIICGLNRSTVLGLQPYETLLCCFGCIWAFAPFPKSTSPPPIFPTDLPSCWTLLSLASLLAWWLVFMLCCVSQFLLCFSEHVFSASVGPPFEVPPQFLFCHSTASYQLIMQSQKCGSERSELCDIPNYGFQLYLVCCIRQVIFTY